MAGVDSHSASYYAPARNLHRHPYRGGLGRLPLVSPDGAIPLAQEHRPAAGSCRCYSGERVGSSVDRAPAHCFRERMSGYSILPHPTLAGQWDLVCHRLKGRSIRVTLPEGEEAKRVIEFVAERLPIVDAAAMQER